MSRRAKHAPAKPEPRPVGRPVSVGILSEPKLTVRDAVRLLTVGTRVRFLAGTSWVIGNEEPAISGLTGVVSYVSILDVRGGSTNESTVAVKLDDPTPLLDEWDNCLVFGEPEGPGLTEYLSMVEVWS